MAQVLRRCGWPVHVACAPWANRTCAALKKLVRCDDCMEKGLLRLVVCTSGGAGNRLTCDWCRCRMMTNTTDAASMWCGKRHSNCRALVIKNESDRQGNTLFLSKGLAPVKEVVPYDEVKLIDVDLSSAYNNADYAVVATSSLGKALVLIEIDNNQHAGGGQYSPELERQKNTGNFACGKHFDRVLLLRISPSAKMVRRPTLPPSAFSKYSVWHGAHEEARGADSQFLTPFLDFRAWGSEPPMPITLVDPALARICEAFSGKGQHGAAPTTAELLTVAKLTRMAGHFASEGERRDRFLDILNDYLGGEGPLAVKNIGRFETDGTILVGGSEGMPIVILEVKDNVGESGDPGPQGQDYYRRYLLDRANKPGTAATVRDTPCPCLLLELMGPELRVSAMASTCDIQVHCQPLTPRLHLYDMFAADWEHMVAVAKVLRAIKFGAAELRQGYASGGDASAARAAKRHRPSTAPGAANQPGQPLQRDPSLPLPYPLRPGSGCIASAKLPEPLLPPRQGCLLYRFWPAADAQSRLVKFVQRSSYGEAVHRAWAKQGLAPALYGVQQLPGGLCMVQMEELQRGEGEAGWRSVAEIPAAERTEQLRAAVVGALQRASAVDIGDGKRGVHGDARAANVLVRGTLPAAGGSPPHVQEQQGPASTDIEVRFVDFDWAGIAGEAELPLWAVPRRALPDNRKLTTEYDLAVLDETWQLDFTTGVVQVASEGAEEFPTAAAQGQEQA